jgi:putative DNA primase/helicase
VPKRTASRKSATALRAYILQRAGELPEDQYLLVVAQKKFVSQLRETGLPNNVMATHFGALAGLDCYKEAAGMVVIGRPQPSGYRIRNMLHMLTGDPGDERGADFWFDRVVAGIQCADGTVRATEHFQDIDPVAESLRWLTCEAELIQAIGRIRPCRRDTPAFIDLLCDVPLPIVVDEVCQWREVRLSSQEEALVDLGFLAESPEHLHLLTPGVWSSADAARKWLARGAGGQTPISKSLYRDLSACCRYQMPGPGQKWRRAHYDPRRIGSPRAWLEERLGPVANFAC